MTWRILHLCPIRKTMSKDYSNKLRNLFETLLLQNNNRSVNITDADWEIFVDYIAGQRLKMEQPSNETYHSYQQQDEVMGCGGAMKSLAIKYADFYHPYLSICVCCLGTIANVLNIAVLTRKEMAAAPINRILTALAVADMLLMIEYIPYAYYYFWEVKTKMEFPYAGAVYMLFHSHVTQILHTTSIWLTLTLAIWRYLAIGYPEKSHILCSDWRCSLAILLSYVLPIFLCAPVYVQITIRQEQVKEDKIYTLYHVGLADNRETLLKVNFWIYAVFIKLLPCFILTVISCWLIRTLFKAKKRKQVLRGYDSYPLTTPNGQDCKAKKPTKAERRADRTTKMLVAVLILFLITEFPQGIFAFLIGIKGKNLFLTCYQTYGEIMDILALLNGAINFILYCCMNRMFRATFGQLFKPKMLANWAPAPPSEIHTTTVSCGTNTTEF